MDPALRELLRRSGAAPDEVLEAIVRLRRPGLRVPGVRIVSRFGTVATCRLPMGAVWAVHDHPHVASLKAARPVVPSLDRLDRLGRPGGNEYLDDGKSRRARGD